HNYSLQHSLRSRTDGSHAWWCMACHEAKEKIACPDPSLYTPHYRYHHPYGGRSYKAISSHSASWILFHILLPRHISLDIFMVWSKYWGRHEAQSYNWLSLCRCKRWQHHRTSPLHTRRSAPLFK